MSAGIFTIGHSNHAIGAFMDLLRAHDITLVADVRSMPFSRFNPHFNRERLREHLRTQGIGYAFLGRELGARSEDESCYEGDTVSYNRLAGTSSFAEGIARVRELARTERVALMCAEKEPLDCHRTILVAKRLTSEGVGVSHILANGGIESYEHALLRLVKRLDLDQDELFGDSSAERAIAMQASRIAYVRRSLRQ